MPSYIRAFPAPAAVPGELPLHTIYPYLCVYKANTLHTLNISQDVPMDLGAPRAQTRRQQVRGGVIHCSVKTLGARENNVQVKDAQTWVMLKTNSY